ncbi:hypothetical protein NDU88_004497 [Pleurodeles waltl]|uniref:Uncharacterized protein n=1 Tax=Pleurodeles waltl TaxID=8319 RepID=A0AAV7VIH0_PLEWA|nr:hypothetical protein NDU88_004497 [Pleurodeles waltl]
MRLFIFNKAAPPPGRLHQGSLIRQRRLQKPSRRLRLFSTAFLVVRSEADSGSQRGAPHTASSIANWPFGNCRDPHFKSRAVPWQVRCPDAELRNFLCVYSVSRAYTGFNETAHAQQTGTAGKQNHIRDVLCAGHAALRRHTYALQTMQAHNR